MKVFILFLCGVSLSAMAGAQSGDPSTKDKSRAAAPAPHDIVPLPSIKTLSAGQAAGKKLFVQRCSVCHLPALPSYKAYGPLLDGALIEERGDDTERQQIAQGSARMPGFQYTLSATEIDQIVSYLKTLPGRSREQ